MSNDPIIAEVDRFFERAQIVLWAAFVAAVLSGALSAGYWFLVGECSTEYWRCGADHKAAIAVLTGLSVFVAILVAAAFVHSVSGLYRVIHAQLGRTRAALQENQDEA